MSNDLQDFQKELKTLGDKIPVSASKIGSITKLAMKYISDSNQIVEIISSFIKQCKPEVKLGAMYLIDSICRASQKLSESENLYPKNFEIVLPDLFWELTKCPPKDKDKMKRVLHLWISSNILSIDVLKKINKVHFEAPKPSTDINHVKETPAPIGQPPAPSAPSWPISNENPSAITFDPKSMPITLASLGLATGTGSAGLAGLGDDSLVGLSSVGFGTPGSLSSFLPNLLGLQNSQPPRYDAKTSTPPALLNLLGAQPNEVHGNIQSVDRRYSSPVPKPSDLRNDYGDMSRNTSYDSHGYSDHRQPSHQPDSRFENSSYSSGTGYANRNDSASYGSDPRYPNHVDNPPYPSDSRYPDHNNNPPYQSDSRYPSNNNPPFSSDSRYPNRNDNPPYQSDTRYPNHNDHSQYGSDGRYSSNDNPAYGTEPRYSNQNTHAGYSNQDDRRNDFDYDDRAPDNYSNYPPKQFGNDSAPSAYANRDRPKPYDRARPNERRPAETKRTFGEFKVPPGPVCVPSRYDASVPNDCIKFLSRTLYISDMPASCTKEQLKKLLQQAGRVESMTFNTQRMCSFIKTPTRKEAEDIRNQFQGYKIDNQMIKIGWGCGYGPREHFNYAEGVTLFPISKIPLQDQAFIVAAPPRGGGPIEGSTVTEEPNVPLELALSSRGSSTAPRVGLPPRRRDRRDERGDYGGGRY